MARTATMSDDMGLMQQNKTVRTIVVSGVLAAIQLALGITGIGFIPLPTGVNATILHIPAILAGVMEGPVAGLAVGGIFGLFSFLRSTTPLSPTRSSRSARACSSVSSPTSSTAPSVRSTSLSRSSSRACSER
jgi:uncharacterized membrane protein